MKPSQKPLRSILKRTLMIGLGLTGWFIGFGALLLITLPKWLPYAADWANQKGNWWDELQFTIANIDANQLTIKNVHFRKDTVDVHLAGATITYQPAELIKGKIGSILLQPIEIEANLDLSTPEQSSDSSAPMDVASILRTPLPDLPFHEVIGSSIRFGLSLGKPQIIESQMYITATHAEKSLTTEAHADVYGNSLTIQSNIAFDPSSLREFSLSADFRQPQLLAQKVLESLPIPESFNFENAGIGLSSGSALLDWNNQSSVFLARANLLGLKIQNQLIVDEIDAEIDAPDSLISIHGFLDIKSVQNPLFYIQRPEIEFTVKDPLSASPSVDSLIKIPELSVSLTMEQTYNLSPVELKIGFSDNQLQFSAPEIQSMSIPVILHDVESTIHLPDTDPSTSFQAKLKVTPIIPDWAILPSNPDTAIELKVDGQSLIPITGIESLSSVTHLSVPETSIKGKLALDPETSVEVSIVTAGQVDADQSGKNLAVGASFQIPQFLASQKDLYSITGTASVSANLNFDLLTDWTAFDPFHDIPTPAFSLAFDASGSFLKTPVQIKNLTFATESQTSDTQSPTDSIPYRGSIESVSYDAWKLSKLDATGSITKDTLESHVTAELLNSTLVLEANTTFHPSIKSAQGSIKIASPDPQARTSIALQRYVQNMATTIASALVSISADFEWVENKPLYTVKGSIMEGLVTMPDSGISIEGVELPDIFFSNINPSEPSSRFMNLKIGKINVAPTVISNIHCKFAVDENLTITLDSLQFEFCEGQFYVISKQPIQAPYDTASFRVEFTDLNLKLLTNLIPDFKEDLSGIVDGYLPIRIEKGQIAWGKGLAKLKQGTTGRLRYDENGLIAAYIPEIVISEKLDIDINKALRDITLTDFSIDIQSSNHFDEPSVVHISGHSNNSKIEIPIESIQLNIRAGDIPGLINQTFNKGKWFDSIIFK